jgi:hypothetical protein
MGARDRKTASKASIIAEMGVVARGTVLIGSLDGGAVLPGFRVALADLFAEPAGPQ